MMRQEAYLHIPRRRRRKRDHLLGSAMLEAGTSNFSEAIDRPGGGGPDFNVLGNALRWLKPLRGGRINDNRGDQCLAILIEREHEILRQRIVLRRPAALADGDGAVDQIRRRPRLVVVLGRRSLDLAAQGCEGDVEAARHLGLLGGHGRWKERDHGERERRGATAIDGKVHSVVTRREPSLGRLDRYYSLLAGRETHPRVGHLVVGLYPLHAHRDPAHLD